MAPSPLKVLIVLDEYLPVTAAPSVRIHNFISALDGDEITVIGGTSGKVSASRNSSGGIREILLARPPETSLVSFVLFLLRIQWTAFKTARSAKAKNLEYDVILVSVPKYEMLWSFPFLKPYSSRLILDLRDSFGFLDYPAYLSHFLPRMLANPVGNFVKRTIAWVQARAVDAADTVTVANSGIAQTLRDASAKVSIISNGVDVELFTPTPNTRSHERTDTQDLSLIYVGNFAEKDSFAILERVLPEFGAKVKLHLVGQGRNKAKVLERLQTSGVHFVDHGVVAHKVLPELLSQMDAGCIFRNDRACESIPVSLFEYCAMGLPSICNPVGLMKTFVESNQSGFLVDTSEQLKTVIECLRTRSDSPTQFQDLHNLAREKFSLQAQAKVFRDLLHAKEIDSEPSFQNQVVNL